MRRLLRRDRGFHALVILLLGIGIGANTLVFSLVNELLLKPLPVRDPKNLYRLQRLTRFMPDPYFRDWHLQDVVLKSPAIVAAVAEQPCDPGSLVPLAAGDGVRLITAQVVSPNYFAELGVRAFVGRVLDESDAKVSGVIPAVLSHQFWRATFGGDPGAIGRTIRVKNTPLAIVGVLPPEFHGSDVDRAPDIRVPVAAAGPLFGGIRKVPFQILVRLAPGVTPGQAASTLYPGLKLLDDTSEDDYRRGDQWTLGLAPMERGVSRMRDQFAGALRILLGGVAMLMLAVCVNIAGLLIAKSAERRRELSIRAAVGASRGRILRQLLGESFALAIPGAALGALLAWMLAPRVIALLPPVRDLAQLATPQILAVRPDWNVLLFFAGLTIFCVVASGLVPAWRASRVDLSSQMWPRSGKGSLIPVAAQAVFGMVLLSASGLMLRSYRNLDRLDSGYDREHLIEFNLDAGRAGYDARQSGNFFRELRVRVAALPGVRGVAYATRGVMRGAGIKTTLAPLGVELPKGTFLNTSLNSVTPGFFETMGIPVLSGRDLRRSDARVAPVPIVVNAAFALHFFPGQDAVGKRMSGGGPRLREIVGVVRTAKYRSMREPDPPTFYDLLDESTGVETALVLYIQTQGAPAPLSGAIRQTIQSLDAGVPITEASTLDAEIRGSLWQERLVAILSAFFGIASVALAGIGLYGALSLSVARRRRELGIRVAVGATRRDVIGAVCSPMAAAVGAGLAAGLAVSAALLRATRPLLFGVAETDALSLAAAAALIVLCAIAAAVPPALRAARVDPAATLRES